MGYRHIELHCHICYDYICNAVLVGEQCALQPLNIVQSAQGYKQFSIFTEITQIY